MKEVNQGLPYLREINIAELIRKIIKGKKYFLFTLPIALVISSLIVICIPRTYICEVKLAPESSSPNIGGLNSIASSLGMNIGNMTNQDAIIPELYPDLMKSTDFRVSMFDVKVTTKNGKINTTYFDYLKNNQKFAYWDYAIIWILSKFTKDEEEISGNGQSNKVNPFMMSKSQNDIAKIIEGKIKCNVDKKTDVITINVEDQDPLVCATIADSARVKLQQFITNYRTSKARIDLAYAKRLNIEAKQSYLKAQKLYAAYADANEGLALESFKAKRDELENEMQLLFNNYQQTALQLQLAKAKLQERTPAFTTLQSASVPLRPSSPKRMFFVMFWLFVTFCGTSIYVYRKDI